MVLTKYDIKALCKTQSLIRQYDDHNIQSNSYDLRMGDQYYCYSYEDGKKLKIRDLGTGTESDEFEIPADAICYVISLESLEMPLNLTAEITLSFGLIKKGVMLAKQPPIDPGYKGRIVALLHNLSNEPIKIRRGDHILSVVFYELKQQLRPEDAYHASYQNMMTLKQFGMKNGGGALFALKHDMEEQADKVRRDVDKLEKKQKKSLNRIMAETIGAITIIIAALTILVTYVSVRPETISGKNNDSVSDVANIHVGRNEITFGSYTISLDGGNISAFSIDDDVITIKLGTDGE